MYVDLDLALFQRTSAKFVTDSSSQTSPACPGIDKTAVAAFHAEIAPWIRGTAYTILAGGVCFDPFGSDCSGVYLHRTVTIG